LTQKQAKITRDKDNFDSTTKRLKENRNSFAKAAKTKELSEGAKIDLLMQREIKNQIKPEEPTSKRLLFQKTTKESKTNNVTQSFNDSQRTH